MAITLYGDGTSRNAKYAGGFNNGSSVATTATAGRPTSLVDASALSGYSIDLKSKSGGISYASQDNINPKSVAFNGSFSVFMRVKFSAIGASISNIFNLGRISDRLAAPYVEVYYWSASGGFRTYVTNDAGLVGINGTYVAGNSITTGVWYDLGFSFNNTNGEFKLYQDATLLNTLTSSRLFDEPQETLQYASLFSMGWGQGWHQSYYDLAEFAFYGNEVVDFTSSSFNLVGGAGSLNGASRMALLDVSSYSGLVCPAANVPDESDVRLAITYDDGAGNDYTGSLVVPDVANVPAIGNVRLGVTYDDGAGNDYTGNLVVPAVGIVKQGEQYGALGTEYTGTLWVPGIDAGNGTWAPLEVQKAIYQVLINDDGIIDLLGGDSNEDTTTDKVFDFVPDNTVTPYIVVTIFNWQDRSNATFDGMESELQISVWYEPGEGSNTSRGNKPVQLIQERIDQLFNNTNLCIDGWNSLQLRRTLITIETQDDNVTKHGIQRFNLKIGEK